MALTNPALAEYLGLTTFPQISGATVSDSSVLQIPPAWSAIRYISEGIASLSRSVYLREPDGDIVPDHGSPVAALFDGRPHPHYTTFDFLQAVVANACLGNGYARIYKDSVTARPVMLEIIPQEFVHIVYSSAGEMYYHVSGIINDKSVNYYLPQTEMLHIKGVTFTGILGKKTSIVHAGSFSTSLGAQEYGNTWFSKGASVGGLITFPTPLIKEQREMLRSKIEAAHSGSKNAGSIMVLDSGADFKAIQSGPQDAAVIDFNNLSTIQVSQIFKIPLHLLSQLDRSTFSNMEQQNQDFVVHCLQPWARKIEEEFNTKLFTTSEIRNRKRFFAFDLSPLQMGDMDSQAAFFASAIQNGWMTPNEVRAKKNLNRIEGGDQLFIQQNMAPMDRLNEILDGKNGKETPEEAQSAESDNDNEDEQPEPAA
ncbi:MAG: phage portal protein [Candidatus Obscuribacter sp.]|nr:phage portal protein [Candidatus Obscuribacter sp.]